MRLNLQWQGHAALWLCCLSVLATLPAEAWAQSGRTERLNADASRMVFKEGKKDKQGASCKLTVMHVYTSKFNNKHTQFAFTGSVVAKREKGKDLMLTVVGQNHELSPVGNSFKPFPLPRIELGVEDASVRRYAEHKQKCKPGHVCAAYKDSKKHELQTWVSDDKRNLSLLFPLITKQPSVVIDLSKFGPSGKDTEPPLARFKSCAAQLR